MKKMNNKYRGEKSQQKTTVDPTGHLNAWKLTIKTY